MILLLFQLIANFIQLWELLLSRFRLQIRTSSFLKVWIIMVRIQEIEDRSVDKVFDSKEKAEKYVREQENRENLPNLNGFDRSVEEWEVE